MSTIRILIVMTLFFILVKPTYAGDFTIVIHGGAGYMSKDMPPEMQKRYLETLDSALQIGAKTILNGGSAVDAVENVLKYLEDCPLYNAGRGAVYNFRGNVELDASIMDGTNLKAGAVAGVTRVKNPISAARKVMEKSDYVMLCKAGADSFAWENHLDIVPNSYFKTTKNTQSYNKEKEKYLKNKMGTVGCVVLDKQGNLAAGTSTGGLEMKKWGRIGDSPIIGAGTYADNLSCAVSCTGIGEYFIRLGIAKEIASRMELKGIILEQAANETLKKLDLYKGIGGFIAIDKKANFVMKFNTPGMFRGYIRENGEKKVSIF